MSTEARGQGLTVFRVTGGGGQLLPQRERLLERGLGLRSLVLFRDRECRVTSVSNAPIPWPRVQPVEELGGSDLWVCAELVKAIRTESASALKHHFGTSTTTVWAWRKEFGVGGRATTRGSKRAIRAAAKLGAAVKAKRWTDEKLDQKATAKRLGLRPGPR